MSFDNTIFDIILKTDKNRRILFFMGYWLPEKELIKKQFDKFLPRLKTDEEFEIIKECLKEWIDYYKVLYISGDSAIYPEGKKPMDNIGKLVYTLDILEMERNIRFSLVKPSKR